MNQPPAVPSLLWLATPPRTSGSAPWYEDLALEPITQALSLHGRYTSQVRNVLSALCSDPAVIMLRQQVLADLLRLPALAEQLASVLPLLAAAGTAGTGRWTGDSGVLAVVQQISDLEAYVAAIQGTLAALETAQGDLQAQGLLRLHAALSECAASAEFRTLEQELPLLREQLEQAGSVTLGINLDAQLRPESATLLQVSRERFGGPRSLFGRLFGAERAKEHGLTPLRQAGERQTFGPDRQLFLDLSQLLEEVVAPLASSLTRFSRGQGAALANLEGELAFYLGAVRFTQRLREAGFQLCQPAIISPAERRFVAEELYNQELVLRLQAGPPRSSSSTAPTAVVPNDCRFDEAGRIFLLTGPNRGGKTTFTRAVGQAQVLAQAGLMLPARAAELSPVDAIFTLFPAAEQGEVGMGRLDEEAARLASIFRSATEQSLVLLNEPLGSTSPHDAQRIARDLLSGLRMLGARAIFVTHLHDLAREAASLNQVVAGNSAIATLVAVVDEAASSNGVTRTYRVVPGLPDGNSHADDIVLAHGLQLRQIERTLRERRAAASPGSAEE